MFTTESRERHTVRPHPLRQSSSLSSHSASSWPSGPYISFARSLTPQFQRHCPCTNQQDQPIKKHNNIGQKRNSPPQGDRYSGRSRVPLSAPLSSLPHISVYIAQTASYRVVADGLPCQEVGPSPHSLRHRASVIAVEDDGIAQE